MKYAEIRDYSTSWLLAAIPNLFHRSQLYGPDLQGPAFHLYFIGFSLNFMIANVNVTGRIYLRYVFKVVNLLLMYCCSFLPCITEMISSFLFTLNIRKV